MDDDELPMSMFFEFSHLLNMIDLELGLTVELIDNHNDNLAVGHDEILDEFFSCERFESLSVKSLLEVGSFI